MQVFRVIENEMHSAGERVQEDLTPDGVLMALRVRYGNAYGTVGTSDISVPITLVDRITLSLGGNNFAVDLTGAQARAMHAYNRGASAPISVKLNPI